MADFEWVQYENESSVRHLGCGQEILIKYKIDIGYKYIYYKTVATVKQFSDFCILNLDIMSKHPADIQITHYAIIPE